MKFGSILTIRFVYSWLPSVYAIKRQNTIYLNLEFSKLILKNMQMSIKFFTDCRIYSYLLYVRQTWLLHYCHITETCNHNNNKKSWLIFQHFCTNFIRLPYIMRIWINFVIRESIFGPPVFFNDFMYGVHSNKKIIEVTQKLFA